MVDGSITMITAIISKAYVNGAEIWLIGWFACTLLFFAILLLLKKNRTKESIKNLFLCLLSAEIIVDLAWALIFYNKSGYVNHGIGSVYGLLLWPVALAASGIIATKLNKKAGI
jgi:hypothetical protein